MPSGYTHAVQQGISFEDFVMRCSRAMGATIMMRDDPLDAPIPVRFEPSDYHSKALKKAQEDLAWLEQIPASEAEREAEKEYTDDLDRNSKGLQESIDIRNKYQAMLADVVQWVPPTPDHEGLKKFMVDQLHESIKFDCSEDYYRENVPSKLSGEQWKAEKIAKAKKDIGYHSAELEKEVERTESRNQWLKALRDSLSRNDATLPNIG